MVRLGNRRAMIESNGTAHAVDYGGVGKVLYSWYTMYYDFLNSIVLQLSWGRFPLQWNEEMKDTWEKVYTRRFETIITLA